MAQESFDLHVDLNEFLKSKGKNSFYRPTNTYEVVFRNVRSAPKPKERIRMKSEQFISKDIVVTNQLGNIHDTAQVHPKFLVQNIISFLQSENKINLHEHSYVQNIEEILFPEIGLTAEPLPLWKVTVADGTEFVAKNIIIAVGPWSTICPFAIKFPELSMVTSTRVHSLIADPSAILSSDHPEWPAECIFLQTRDPKSHKWSEPEFYPRADGTIYFCGGVDEPDVPVTPKDVTTNPELVQEISDSLKCFCPGIEIQKSQACYLPHSKDGIPIFGKTQHKNAFVATGHGVWGILLAPATGKRMARLIMHPEAEITSKFDAKRGKECQETRIGPCAPALYG